MTNKVILLMSWIILFSIVILLYSVAYHPIHLMILLLIYNIILCINLSMWKLNYVFSVLFFLIMISGLMIIFLYFSSLISNEKTLMKLNKMSIMFMSMIVALLIFFLFINDSPFYSQILDHIYSSLNTPDTLFQFNSTLPLFNQPLLFMTMLNMLYLLLALLLIIKVSSPKIKALRKLS